MAGHEQRRGNYRPAATDCRHTAEVSRYAEKESTVHELGNDAAFDRDACMALLHRAPHAVSLGLAKSIIAVAGRLKQKAAMYAASDRSTFYFYFSGLGPIHM
jgi:hypothetical protein